MPDRMPEDMSEYMPEDMPDRMSDKMSDRMPEDMPEHMPDRMPDRMPEGMSEFMQEHMPEDMPDRMPEDMLDRMPEDMSDRMPEDLPVRKSINVMVGITRSKVIQPNNVQNRSNPARPPQCLNLTTSKTKQFCEISFKNGKFSAALGASYQCVLRFFHSTCVKYCACHEKLMPGHTTCRTCHAKSSQQTWRSDAPN